jgi:hypothetical protein
VIIALAVPYRVVGDARSRAGFLKPFMKAQGRKKSDSDRPSESAAFHQKAQADPGRVYIVLAIFPFFF